MIDNYNKQSINQNELQEVLIQQEKIKKNRQEKIQKIRIIAEKLGINIDNLSESQIDNLLNKLDTNSIKLLQKLSEKIQYTDQQYAMQLQEMIINGDFDKAIAFLEEINKKQNDLLNNFNDNFASAHDQVISQTIQDFMQSQQYYNDDTSQQKQIQSNNNNQYDFNIIKYSINQQTNIITIYADISKIKGYTLIGFSFKITGNNILDIICTHDTKKDFFNNEFVVYKFSNMSLITENDFVLTMLKIIGDLNNIIIKDIKIRVLIDNIEKEINVDNSI